METFWVYLVLVVGLGCGFVLGTIWALGQEDREWDRNHPG